MQSWGGYMNQFQAIPNEKIRALAPSDPIARRPTPGILQFFPRLGHHSNKGHLLIPTQTRQPGLPGSIHQLQKFVSCGALVAVEMQKRLQEKTSYGFRTVEEGFEYTLGFSILHWSH